jgi:hypothetical protein
MLFWKLFIFLQPNGYRKYYKVSTKKKILEHRLSDERRNSKILNNALLHTTIFELFFFWKFTNTWPIDLAKCQLFVINCPHDELFEPPRSVSRKASEYFSHFISKREFYDMYHATWQSWNWPSGNSALKCSARHCHLEHKVLRQKLFLSWRHSKGFIEKRMKPPEFLSFWHAYCYPANQFKLLKTQICIPKIRHEWRTLEQSYMTWPDLTWPE